MNKVVTGSPNVFANLNDILVMFRTKEQHTQILDKLFDRFKVHGLVVNETKCVFCVSSLNFLDHKVSENDIALARKKYEKLQRFNNPQL